MKSPIVSLAYRSRASDGAVDPASLVEILAVSQAHNVENDITGALAYGEGRFVQVLEGPEGALTETMARIRADRRHHSLDILGPRPIDRRAFPDWCMASLTDEPGLAPTLSLIFGDWETHGTMAAELLAAALNDDGTA